LSDEPQGIRARGIRHLRRVSPDGKEFFRIVLAPAVTERNGSLRDANLIDEDFRIGDKAGFTGSDELFDEREVDSFFNAIHEKAP
jgi:hypothetical protein